jgi:hypothetical protein
MQWCSPVIGKYHCIVSAHPTWDCRRRPSAFMMNLRVRHFAYCQTDALSRSTRLGIGRDHGEVGAPVLVGGRAARGRRRARQVPAHGAGHSGEEGEVSRHTPYWQAPGACAVENGIGTLFASPMCSVDGAPSKRPRSWLTAACQLLQSPIERVYRTASACTRAAKTSSGGRLRSVRDGHLVLLVLCLDDGGHFIRKKSPEW